MNDTMDIGELLRQKKSSVLERWRGMIRDAYPEATGKFLRECGDRFDNPVGYIIVRSTETLYDALLEPVDADALASDIDALVRIRAVQDFSPASAVGFVFSLKEAIRQELADRLQAEGAAVQLLSFDSRIDDWALLAFDVYVKCREQIYSLRVDEIKRLTQSALDRANRELP